MALIKSEGGESIMTVRSQRTPLCKTTTNLSTPFTDQFRPENIYRLFWKYQTEWHPKQDERFLDRKEFTDLVHELQTTKITTVHDEGMRRLKEGGFCSTSLISSSYFTSSYPYSRQNK